VDSGSDFSTTWHTSFARCHQALMTGDANAAVEAAAALALHLAARSGDGAWSATLDGPRRVQWDRWVLPPAAGIDVRVAGDAARISLGTSGGRNRCDFERTRRGWDLVRGDAEAFPVALAGPPRVLLLAPPSLAGIEWAEGEPNEPCLVEPEDIVRSVRAAAAMLRRAAPPYWPWVRRVVRGIIPIGGSDAMLRSGSSATRPGLIGVSFPASPAAIAEMLVHEASHQYFHLLARLQRPDDGTDPQLYYSPVKRTGRPIRAILVAYHAFANVLLFYRLTRRHGVDGAGYCAREARKLVPQLRELEQPLRTSPALTRTGHALWKPLAARLHL
jgi:HEXXH motif-containing protein